MGSPKGRKILGDGVAIVSAQSLNNRSHYLVRKLHTNVVMHVERKVPQRITLPDESYLGTGLARLNRLAEESLTRKLKI